MATFYLDLEGGNDSNDGTTFANRWKTFASGATAARIAPGDTIRIMGSPAPTLVDSSASWTQNSKTVTLSGAVTANISTCETAWTASANVTATTTGTAKEGTNAASIAIASAFTTGKAAFFATGTLDLSTYQQVSFWVQCNTTVAASVLSLRLCTDTAGNTSVHTIAIPAINASGQWQPVTVDLATNMNSAIASVALYQDTDISAATVLLDNIIACKASSTASALTLTSLIGKVHNLSWVASTTYAANSIRIPTTANRNGYRYKVTAGGGGAAGSSEPTWPLGIGKTVTDGALTWTCDALEDTWFGIKSINGTTVILDNGVNSASGSGRGYEGTTESVATYKRECISQGGASGNFTAVNQIQDDGSSGSPITYSGGWDRTNMSTQVEQTWLDGTNGMGLNIAFSSHKYITITNIGSVRFSYGFYEGNDGLVVKYCHSNNFSNHCRENSSNISAITIDGCNFSNSSRGIVSSNPCSNDVFRTTLSSHTNNGWLVNGSTIRASGRWTEIVARNNGAYAFDINKGCDPLDFRNVTTGNNGSGAFSMGSIIRCFNCNLPESTAFGNFTNFARQVAYSQKHSQTADNHLITTDGGTIISATDQRHTASGISWKFRPTSTNRGAAYPLILSVAKIKVTSGVTSNIAIWTRRDNTNIQGQLIVEGGQVAGVEADVTVSCAPSINTWTQSSTLSITPTEDGAVEVKFYCWDGTGTSNNMWIDDLTVT